MTQQTITNIIVKPLAFPAMTGAIDLNDDFVFWAREIDDISGDR